MAEFTHDGLKFNYEVIGEGFPFFLLHGLGNNNLQTREMYQPIEGIQCILPDQRCHGLSEGDADMRLNTLAEDIIKLADHLGIDSFAIGGISMGAAVSLRTCLNYPQRVKGLLLIRNAWADKPMPKPYVELFAALARALRKNDPEVLRRSQAYQTLHESDPAAADSVFDFFNDPVALKYSEKFALVPPQFLIQSHDELHWIQVPTMILANRQDNIHQYGYGLALLDGIRNSQFHEIPCKKENREQYHAEINRYLKLLLAEIDK